MQLQSIKFDWKYLFSLASFLLLCAHASAVGLCVSAIIVLMLAPLFRGEKLDVHIRNLKLKYSLCSVTVVALVAITFYMRWLPSGLVASIAALLRLDVKIILIIASLVLAIFAFPCVYRILTLINSSEQQKYSRLASFLESKSFLWICTGIFGVCIACMVLCSFNKSTWIDELFTMRMISYSYPRIIELCSMDVHVPVYYFITKAVVDALHFCFPNASAIYFAKLSSIIPFLIMGGIVLTVIKKRWGNFTAGLFLVCLVGMPQMMHFGIEIRMYSWAMLFLLIAFLSADGAIKTGKVKYWALLSVFSLAAAYTHHYGLISVAGIWFGLMIWHIADKERKFLTWLIWGSLTILGYLPWLAILLGQLNYVNNSYWIPDITLPTVIGYFGFLFENLWLFILFMAAVISAVKIAAKEKSNEAGIAVLGMSVVIFVMLIGIVVSLAFKPVFVSRYLLPGFSCLWLGVVITYQLKNNGLLRYVAVLLALVTTALGVTAFLRIERESLQSAAQLYEELEKYKGYTVVSTDDFVNREIAVITGNECYLWSGDAEILMESVYGNIYDLNEDADAIHQWLENGEKVIFASDANNDTEICAEITEKYGFNLEKLGSYAANAGGAVQKVAIYELTASSKSAAILEE